MAEPVLLLDGAVVVAKSPHTSALFDAGVVDGLTGCGTTEDPKLPLGCLTCTGEVEPHTFDEPKRSAEAAPAFAGAVEVELAAVGVDSHKLGAGVEVVGAEDLDPPSSSPPNASKPPNPLVDGGDVGDVKLECDALLLLLNKDRMSDLPLEVAAGTEACGVGSCQSRSNRPPPPPVAGGAAGCDGALLCTFDA